MLIGDGPARLKVWVEKGPFQGIAGMCEGASLAAYLAMGEQA